MNTFKKMFTGFSDSRIHLTLDSRLAYRNKGDLPNEWKYYASSLEQRTVECDFDYVNLYNYR